MSERTALPAASPGGYPGTPAAPMAYPAPQLAPQQPAQPLAPRELPTLVMQPPSPIVCPFCNQTVVPVLRTFESYSADTNKKAFFLWGCCCIPCLLFPMWGGSRVQKTVMQCPNCQTFIQ